MSDSWLEGGLDMLKEHAGGSSSVVAPGQVRAEPSFNECVFCHRSLLQRWHALPN